MTADVAVRGQSGLWSGLYKANLAPFSRTAKVFSRFFQKNFAKALNSKTVTNFGRHANVKIIA